jgi:hypothetical protein
MSFTEASTTLPRRLDVLPVMENDESEEDKIIKHINIIYRIDTLHNFTGTYFLDRPCTGYHRSSSLV